MIGGWGWIAVPRWIRSAAAGLGALLAAYAAGRAAQAARGREDARRREIEAEQERARRVAAGQSAVDTGRANGRSPAGRLRDNNSKW